MSAYEFLLAAYARVFCRRRLYRLNRFLHQLALRGIGILNDSSYQSSGELEVLRRISTLGGSPTILDVGANEGEYAKEILRLIPGAKVFAFEPHPSTFERLNAEPCGYVPVHAAVSDRAGTATLFDYDRAVAPGSGHASLVPGVIEQIHRAPVARSWTVPCVTLDAFLDERGVGRVHLLKIDVEGAELQVLRGAREAIAAGAIDMIQIEFNTLNAMSRVFMRDFRDLLAGYRVYRLLPDGPLQLETYDPVSEEIFAFQNILFVSERVAADARRVITA